MQLRKPQKENYELSYSEILLYFIEKHRLRLRKQIMDSSLSIPTALSLLPFVFGICSFIIKKYPGASINYFLEKNLPGLGIPTEKLNWDTVQFILKPNLKAVGVNTTDLKAIYQENFIIFNKNIFENLLDQKKFLNQYKKSIQSFSKPQFEVSDKSKIQLISSNTTASFANLDELPAYLESLYNFRKLGKNVNSCPLNIKNAYLLGNNDLKLEIKKTQAHKSFTSSKTNFNHLLFKSTRTQLTNSEFLLGVFRTKKRVLKLKNKFLIFQQELEEILNLFQAELRSLFIKENLILSYRKKTSQNKIKSLRLRKLISKIEKDHISLKKILYSLNEIELVDSAFPARRMSGYRYPDMNSREIHRVLLKQKNLIFRLFFNQSDTYLKISLPGINIEPIIYNFLFKPIPNFPILTKDLILKDFQTKENIFQGDAILLNKSNGFDWIAPRIPNRKVKAKQNLLDRRFTENFEYKQTYQKQHNIYQTLSTRINISLRLWFQRYLSAYTTFGNANKNFLGITKPPLRANKPDIQEKSTQNEIKFELDNLRKYKPQSYRNRLLGPPTNFNFNESPFQVNSDYQTPFVSPDEWEQYSQNIIKNKQSQASALEFCKIPMIQIRMPKLEENVSINTQTIDQISLYDDIDYHFLKNYLQDGVSTKFSLSAEPNFQSIIENDNFGKFFDNGSYKRLPHHLRSKRQFQNNWESLSFQSWLVISQVSFAFLVYKTLRSLTRIYGRELLSYLLDVVAKTGIVTKKMRQQIEYLIDNREKGFRIISRSRQKFTDIVGMQSYLPELSEIVWFLRNSARNFSYTKRLPRGILLIGPPGTGKTLLVQAVAGEANVPVLTLSGGSFVKPGEAGSLKIELLFQEARRMAPCIVFVDEVDSIARKRGQVMPQNPMSKDDLVNMVLNPSISGDTGTDLGKELLESVQEGRAAFNPFAVSDPIAKLKALVAQKNELQQDVQRTKLNILVQFLVELDGIKGRDGVIVIGATNRLNVLDPAVLRPGRFDRLIRLGLPGDEKRIEIMKFYGKQLKLGVDPTISWDYFAERTAGFSAADLASIMNVSGMKAILNQTPHTLESLEYGIDRIMTSESPTSTSSYFKSRKSTKIKDLLTLKRESSSSISTHFFENPRLAYYQAGKIICTSLLEHHPPIVVAQLWSRKANQRSAKIAANLQNHFLRLARRAELEHRIIASYAGKAAEILFLQKLSGIDPIMSNNPLFNVNLSTLGLDDLAFGQGLIKFLIEKWYLYSIQPLGRKLTKIINTRNPHELSAQRIAFLDVLCQNKESSPRPGGQFLPGPFEEPVYEKDKPVLDELPGTQHYYSVPWWQQQTSSQVEFYIKTFPRWNRIYIPNKDENEFNPYWVPPDEYYHRHGIHEPAETTGQPQNNINWWGSMSNSDNSWNLLSQISEEYQIHSLIMQSFNKAFILLNQHRELLDVIASKLLTQKILRYWDLVSLFEKYNLQYKPIQSNIKFEEKTETANQQRILTSDWGPLSRRKKSKWIDFDSLPSS